MAPRNLQHLVEQRFCVHGTWLSGTTNDAPCFAIWSEHVPAEQQQAKASRRALKLHPYAAQPGLFREALAPWLGQTEEAQLIARLPSTAKTPLASNETIDPAALPKLASWHVPALLLDALDAFAFLSRLPAELDLPSNILIGADLRFWQAVARFAGELLVAQRFVPDLLQEDGHMVAIWRPLLDGPEDAVRLDTLVRSMPPACRALGRANDQTVPGSRAFVTDFLETVVDALASDSLEHVATAGNLSPAAKQWLGALTGDDPYVELPAEFVRQFQTWRDAARIDTSGSFRLCFRLDPPDAPKPVRGRPRKGEAKSWRLLYFFQASDDPSLLVAAEDVWNARGRRAKWFDRAFDQPQERMLAGLGLAARIFPPIEDSLHDARPAEAELSVEQAYSFLREGSLLLRGAGFSVLLPNLAAGLSAHARISTKTAKQPKGGVAGLTFHALINFDWGLALGGQELSAEEFMRLAALKQPLVEVRGQWVELRPEQVAQALELLKRREAGAEVTLAEAMRMALAPEAVAGLQVGSVEIEGDLQAVIERLTQPARIESQPLPTGLNATLRHYQQSGFAWMAFLQQLGLGACLADDMGLGKTLQTITLLLAGKQADQTMPPALVICPTSVVGNWRRELERFAPSLRVMTHHGASRERDDFAVQAAQHDVVISAYPLLHRDAEQFSSVDWGTVVLDEAQNIKNADTKQAQAARSLRAAHRVALTGTPVENRLSELWSIFQFLNPGYLGTQASFQRQFAKPIEREQDAHAAQQLRALTGPLILRRVKTDPQVISDLPAKNEMKTYCTLTREQATLYEAVVKDTLRQLEDNSVEGMRRRSLVLTTMLRLKQVCNHPAQFLADGSALDGRSGKLERLVEMLQEMREVGERALIFTQFAEMGTMLQRYLRDAFGEEPLFLHGGTPAKAREPMVRRFQEEPRGPHMFILSIKAGGTGLTLTRANHVFHFDRWWNPAVENQATDRAFRIGQTRSVQVHKYICMGTIEDRIDEMIERKQALSDRIVGTSEDWITELSTEQLRDLFTLRAEAVE